ncbi:MAG TPA: hypothetical protein VH592_03675 [Gemmataceae bacterium]
MTNLLFSPFTRAAPPPWTCRDVIACGSGSGGTSSDVAEGLTNRGRDSGRLARHP